MRAHRFVCRPTSRFSRGCATKPETPLLTFRRAAQRRCGNERFSRATDIATVAITSTAGRPSGHTGGSTHWQRRRARRGFGARSSRRLASTDADEVIRRGATKRDFLTPFDDGGRRSRGRRRLGTADGEKVRAGRCSGSRHRRRGQERTARDGRGARSRASRSLLFFRRALTASGGET